MSLAEADLTETKTRAKPRRRTGTASPRVKIGDGTASRGLPAAAAAADFEAMDGTERREVLAAAGKELASSLGALLLQRMLKESGKSMRQVARESGFDVAVLSNIANGRRASGPDLWTLMALGEAMGLDVTLDFARR